MSSTGDAAAVIAAAASAVTTAADRLAADDTHTTADAHLVALAEAVTASLHHVAAVRAARVRRTIEALGRPGACDALGISRQRLSQLAPAGTRSEMPARTEATQRARAVRDYLAGEGIVSIAKRVHRDDRTVTAWLEDAGVELRHRPR